MLKAVGLGNMNHKPSQMSGGQQRVALWAFISNPEIVYADEPTVTLIQDFH